MVEDCSTAHFVVLQGSTSAKTVTLVEKYGRGGTETNDALGREIGKLENAKYNLIFPSGVAVTVVNVPGTQINPSSGVIVPASAVHIKT